MTQAGSKSPAIRIAATGLPLLSHRALRVFAERLVKLPVAGQFRRARWLVAKRGAANYQQGRSDRHNKNTDNEMSLRNDRR